MTEPNTATVLVHATAPDRVDDALHAIDRLRTDLDGIVYAERVLTAYDVLVVVEFPTEARLTATVRALQALDDVSRTLTLVHVPNPEEAA